MLLESSTTCGPPPRSETRPEAGYRVELIIMQSGLGTRTITSSIVRFEGLGSPDRRGSIYSEQGLLCLNAREV